MNFRFCSGQIESDVGYVHLLDCIKTSPRDNSNNWFFTIWLLFCSGSLLVLVFKMMYFFFSWKLR